MAHRKESYFWTSFSDLMTSLFFVMLVLFVLVIFILHVKNEKMRAMNDELRNIVRMTTEQNEQYKRLLKIREHFKVLSKETSLEYQEENSTFVARELKGKEIFEPNQAEIKSEYHAMVERVGRDLRKTVEDLHRETPSMSFLLVIEGTCAKNRWNPHAVNDPDDQVMYRLSYERALALYNFWNSRGINFRGLNTEVLICGSGFNGINRDNRVEDNNKRFFIQIIPKVRRDFGESGNSSSP